MKVKSGKMFAIPYCNEINDIPLYIRKGYTGEQYLRSVVDQVRCALCRQPQAAAGHGRSATSDDFRPAFQIKYLQRAVAHMKEHQGVWVCHGETRSSTPTRAQCEP